MSVPMNPEIKAQWVAALRSGEYKQGRGYLKVLDDEGNPAYCCLGVLCELAVKAGIIPESRAQNSKSVADDNKHQLYGNDYTYPGESVRVWAGLTKTDPEVEIPEGTVGLSTLNDGNSHESESEGNPRVNIHTFEQIANLIEEQL